MCHVYSALGGNVTPWDETLATTPVLVACGFDYRSTCAKLLDAFMPHVGFPQPLLRLPPSSQYAEALVSSLRCFSVEFTVLKIVPSSKTTNVIKASIPITPIIIGL